MRVAGSVFTTPIGWPRASSDNARKLSESLSALVLVRMPVQYSRSAAGQSRVFKADPALPDAALTDDYLLENIVIAGSPETVARQLIRLRHDLGPFGTLLMAGHDWDQPKLWRRSMVLLARDVMPAFSRVFS